MAQRGSTEARPVTSQETLSKVPRAQEANIKEFCHSAEQALFFNADTPEEWGLAVPYANQARAIYAAASPELRTAIEAIKDSYTVVLRTSRKG